MPQLKIAIAAAAALLCAAAGGLNASPESHLNVAGRSDDLPFTHVVVAGDTVYLSGGLGVDPETGAPPEEVEDEVRLLLDGMKKKLELVELTMDDLVSVQIFCSDISLYEEFNEIYRTFFAERYPARAFIGSGPLLRGARFEVQGVAVRRTSADME